MYTFHTFQDTSGGWRWRLVAENGRIVADSGESYTTEQHVWRAIGAVCANMPEEPLAQRDVQLAEKLPARQPDTR